jgi:phosphohistidine phosphatase SixA
MIVGHNPSMHEFSESFSGKFIKKFSTCGLASFEIDYEWADVNENLGTLTEFKIPSELR